MTDDKETEFLVHVRAIIGKMGRFSSISCFHVGKTRFLRLVGQRGNLCSLHQNPSRLMSELNAAIKN